MSSIQHFVSPKLPTALAHQKNVEVPGQDLLPTIISHVYIVPTKLDIVVFEEALSRTLQLYPHAAGKLRCNNGYWFIEPTNTPVPVDIEYKPDVTSDTLLKGDMVFQDDLSPFLSCEPIKRLPDANSRLCSLKLIFFEHETSIGLKWHHLLGDGTLVFRFMHALSQFYQGLPLEYPPPTFEKYHFPTPSAAMTDEFASQISGFDRYCPLGESDRWEEDFRQTYKSLKWRFDNDDLADLRSVLCSRAPDGSHLSKQDCLSAYVVAVLNHHLSEPVRTVGNIRSYRSSKAPFAHENVAGNMIHQVAATVPQDMAGIASAVRQSLVRPREPDLLHSSMSVLSDTWLKAVNARKGHFMKEPEDDMVLVNSHAMQVVATALARSKAHIHDRIDWCSAHFGFPDGTRFYKPETCKHTLKCLRSNPTKEGDGVWRASQSIDITLAVRAELEPKLLETLARGFRYILDSEHSR